MSKIKMVGLDLDGTLLNDRKELTAYARDVICRALCLLQRGDRLQEFQKN